MSVPAEFDHKLHAILLDGEYHSSEVTVSRDVIDPATEKVIVESFEPGQ